MERAHDRRPELGAAEQALHSVRVVMNRMADVLWQADPEGSVTAITPCRPSVAPCDGTLDDAEVEQVEQLWRKSVGCAERFSARYDVRSPGGTTLRTFLLDAVPVLDQRDEVRYWSGNAIEVDGAADSGTRFIAEAAAVLSSSLNRNTIVNRFIQTSIAYFCDDCVVYEFDDDGLLRLQGIAERRPKASTDQGALEEAALEAARNRQPLLLRDGALAASRSAIAVPVFAGTSCTGTICFLETARPASFAAPDVDVAVAVVRQLALALENIKAVERERHVTDRFQFLAQTTERLFATPDAVKLQQLLLDTLVEVLADYAVAATLRDGRLRITLASGTPLAQLREESERELLAALREGRSLLFGAGAPFRRRPKLGPLKDTRPPKSWMMVPLLAGDVAHGAIICCSNARSFDAGELELLEEIGRRASFALEHAQSFERERRLAHTLQQATLPSHLATVENASLSFVYRPAASEVQVGGDWYDAFEIDGRRILLTVGDVTGHGLQASIVMAKLRHAINVVALYESNPVDILDAAERVLQRRYPGSVATAFVALLDVELGTITYANAGHPYPLLRRADGSIKELEADGLPIGLRSVGAPASPKTERLDDARLLTFYTDGLTEATRDALAGERLLHQAVNSDAVLYVDNPAEFIEAYCLRGQSQDDVAILTLNFVKSTRWKFDSGDCQAARRTRREFVAQLRAMAAPGCDLKAAELIFGELAANVAQHAAGLLEVALEWKGRRAVLHVIDRGQGYSACRRSEGDLLTEHGRGLWLVQRLGAELEIEILPGYGTHVQATLPLCAAPD